MNLTTADSTAITTQHQSAGSRCMRYHSPGIHRGAAIDNLHPFESIFLKAAGSTVAVHIHTGCRHHIQVTLSFNRAADAQCTAIADGLPQRQFHPGINNQTADAAGNQLARSKSIGMRQRQVATTQHHATGMAVIATQGHRAARYHTGASAQRCRNFTRLRQQHSTTHGAAKLHISRHRHCAGCCRKLIGRGIHQQSTAAHLNAGERTICGHILQYLTHRYGVTSRHHIFCEIRGSTGHSKPILPKHQGKPRGQAAMYQLCSAAQYLATVHHLQGIPFGTGKAAFPGVAVHID